jgi:hypothetical protein
MIIEKYATLALVTTIVLYLIFDIKKNMIQLRISFSTNIIIPIEMLNTLE